MARITAPTTTSPAAVVSGTAPGTAIRAAAARTWWRHCRRSKDTAEPADAPPAAEAMARVRYDHARPPAARPSGNAIGAISTAARGYAPSAARRHMAVQARYGAA